MWILNETMLTFFILCLATKLASFVGSTELGSYLVSVNNVEFHGNGRFPESVGVVFGNQGNDIIYLKLERDDEATAILSEELFEISKILPTGVFTERNRDSFAAYTSGNSDVIILQRGSEDDKPKFYGRFNHGNEKLVIQPENGSDMHHRVRRDETNEHHRVRRATDNEYLIELFVFADLSVFEHVRDEVLPSGSTTQDIKRFLKSYLNGITKEVDTIFQYLGQYGTNNTFRVYFQQYQIITDASQQKWVTDNFSNNKLQQAATADLQTYYDTLMTKFAFPYTDHLVHLTRLDLQDDVQVMSVGSVCGSSTAIGTSIARIRYYPVSVAQGIALTFGVEFDGDSNSCNSTDQYIMSTLYGPNDASNQGNKWKFSSCGVETFVSAFNGEIDLSCLQTEDTIFDLRAFDESSSITDLYTLDQQCELLFNNGSTFCDSSAVDCYSSSQGCVVSDVCTPINVPQQTPCNSGNDFVCNYGFCIGSTTSSTTSTTTAEGGGLLSTTETTTLTDKTSTDPFTVPPTTPTDCVVQTGFVEFDLPGCGCCGGCGCDKDCSDCAPGLPSKTQSDSCTKEANCCNSKVRMTTLFVPDGCELTYVPGPRTLVMEKKGWENTDAEVTAEVYQDSYDRWQVNLVPKP